MHFTKPSQPPAPPPSEKPQGLFEEHHDAIPLASLRLAKSEVIDCETQSPLFTITPKANHIFCPPLGNSSLTITHTRTNKTLGSIRFPKLSKSTIPLGINGRGTLLEHAPDKPHWELKSTSIFDRKRKPTTLLWKRDERLWRTVVLVDVAETRNVLARIDGDLLVFEDEDLSFESMNEIVVSAVVLAEHARRRMGDEEVGDLGRSIGDIAGECCERPKVIRYASSPSQNGKLRKERRASSRHGASSGGFAFAGFAAGGYGGGDGGGGGGGGGCDGGGGGGGC